MKKTWTTPEIKVIVKCTPQESVLAPCWSNSGTNKCDPPNRKSVTG